MPSPFPGMDPFVESQEWQGFHLQLIAEFVNRLVPQVRPKYVVNPERRIYLETQPEPPQFVRPDIAVTKATRERTPQASGTAVATIEPSLYTVPLAREQRESYLVIREAANREVVTVVEVLSPGNKRSGSVGRRKYLHKRRQLLASDVNLVEIDLLRAGLRCPTVEPLKATTDYCAMICRRSERPRAEVYEWGLTRPLPTIPIPLAREDRDVTLDLQAAFTAVYDHGGYDYLLRYADLLQPPIREVDANWTAEILATHCRLA